MGRKKIEVVKGFKGFNKNLCCTGGNTPFQYEIGKTYEIVGQLELCGNGFHFCKSLFNVNQFYSFNNEENRYCEIEALGEIIDSDDGIKSVTSKIKIVREIPKEEFMEIANSGSKNSGWCNTGNRNTGDWNTGDWNTGNRNTGDWNTGDCNTGNRNTGNRNTGNRNTGDWNTGNRNTGDCNTGDCNTGNRNTGNRNTGNRNTGDWNTGNRNTGDWNKTNRSSGVFCNEEPKMIMFNKETDMTYDEWKNTRAYDLLNYIDKSQWICDWEMTEEEKRKYPSYKTCGGYLKEIPRCESSKKWWNNLDEYDKFEIFSLPNFDLDIFNDIMELKITKKEYKEVIKHVNS